MAASTALSNTIFPAPESIFEDQLCDLCRILSTIPAKMSLFFLPKCSGRPRYFPMPHSPVMSKQRLILAFAGPVVLDENVIADFALFIRWPDALAYLSRIRERAEQLAGSDLEKNMVSSAKRRLLIGGQLRPTLTHRREPFSCA